MADKNGNGVKHSVLQALFLRICEDTYGGDVPEDIVLMIESIEEVALRKFRIPSHQEVKEYMESRSFLDAGTMASKFLNHYQARGWKYAGNTPLKDWKAAVRTWEDKGAPKKMEVKQEQESKRIV
jgi:hypothetical protein